MPISEDEYEFRQGHEAQTTMSKAELRKTHKPIMEKRRRARINHSLNEIKSLILEAMKKDPARHSKLEKADILEMAVKHLQNVQRQQLAMAMASDPSVLRKFKTGFNECAGEVGRYVNQLENIDQAMQQRITTHLNKCISGIEQIAQINFPAFANFPFFSNYTSSPGNNPDVSQVVGDHNNNPRIQSLQLIPSRLPTGEFALLLPNSSNLPYFQPVQPAQPQRPSAFVKVIPSSQISSDTSTTKPLSPPLSPATSTTSEDIVVITQSHQRNASPQGFRPVNPTAQRTHRSAFTSTVTTQEVHQVPQVTSTQTELKNIKYPIHTYVEKDKKLASPKKLAEPLCIITNQSERFKQAQMIEESATFEENLSHGVKRKFSEHQGLLTVAYPEFLQPSAKVMRTQLVSSPSSSRQIFDESCRKVDDLRDKPSTSKGGDETGSDMWRPW